MIVAYKSMLKYACVPTRGGWGHAPPPPPPPQENFAFRPSQIASDASGTNYSNILMTHTYVQYRVKLNS